LVAAPRERPTANGYRGAHGDPCRKLRRVAFSPKARQSLNKSDKRELNGVLELWVLAAHHGAGSTYHARPHLL
jgi:hypothetical protein